jgi:hypothetical protein
MKARRSRALGATLILGMVVGGVLPWQNSFAQQKAEQVTVGRYQVAALGRDANNGAIVVIDTATGQCWRKIGQPNRNPWEDVGLPPGAPRK